MDSKECELHILEICESVPKEPQIHSYISLNGSVAAFTFYSIRSEKMVSFEDQAKTSTAAYFYSFKKELLLPSLSKSFTRDRKFSILR